MKTRDTVRKVVSTKRYIDNLKPDKMKRETEGLTSSTNNRPVRCNTRPVNYYRSPHPIRTVYLPRLSKVRHTACIYNLGRCARSMTSCDTIKHEH